MNLLDIEKLTRAASELKHARLLLKRLDGETIVGATVGSIFEMHKAGYAHIWVPAPIVRDELNRIIAESSAALQAAGIEDESPVA